jgi:hypothetical protein
MCRENSAMLVLSFLLLAVPEIAAAGNRFFVGPGSGTIAYAGGFGYAGAHPFDDGYDYPFGYGEYAEYGPWAYAGNGGASCYPAVRHVWTGNHWRARRGVVCN